ncbi:ribosomal protein L1 [Desulfonatronospira thiodismutans ASO3-1]|uniref:Large ribosomal subunit protein uL1 n=1 Tax=Desulfonatronospira thiodismutans ASO3-1 TaxID=555779 RepID=D6SUP3_9BACT|nr:MULTISPECIES: 50S ribosomal protein L1 [Desulfonatronospira]EFI33023.1 ribosomal protein L1 [Desulfonatronospira thiodismutans ASO3-1]RQD73339.1 MAG: 50S ribosomal protein L1 [Desulfonatronospira sp. MSAO_Bac3]
MPKRGKRYIESRKNVDTTERLPVDDAVRMAIEASFARFDETVDVAVRLGVNPKHADQMVRGACSLPHGLGKDVRVVAFCKGEKENEALEAGADAAGGEELVEKIRGGWLEFDKAVATPDMMAQVGKIGRVLGPRGLMPNAKTGTVTFDLANTIKELKAGKVDFKVDRTGIIHAPLGKVSFGPDKIRDNLKALVETLQKLKPATAKGTYFRGLALSTTMGPGVKVDSTSLRGLLK